jgi:hypothetical protein
MVGDAYGFQPSASDANGNNLTFAILNQPSWATFNPVTGSLTGTPNTSDIGTYANIVISVSDGQASTALRAFSVSVDEIATGSATVSWVPPTERTDGSALSDLAGFRVYYGKDSAALDQVQTAANPGLTTYVVQNLAPATWYFVVRAYTTTGMESGPSNIASKTIQ